jgi:histidyl-tRNA synthetase
MTLRPVKGMNDILPDEIGRWHDLEAVLRRELERAGYAEIRTPFLEPLELFVRSIGDTTEIVEKQMFTLQRGDETLALRPEGTASVARAYVGHSLQAKEPVTRVYYLGPMFRAEQPQRGRYRQFWQVGAEVFGDAGPGVDAEMIDMLVGILGALGIQSLEVCVNSLGSHGTRARYRDALFAYLEPKKSSLSEHAQKRLADNPLRILDSKNPKDQEAVKGAPSILDLLEPDDQKHWEGLKRALEALGTPFVVAPDLVRGLDYYTRTLFEIRSSEGELGAQNALLGGGRYDRMVEELGGPNVPAVGFAMGLERVLLAMPERKAEVRLRCFIAPLGERAAVEALVIARELRQAGVTVVPDTRGGSLKSLLRRADSLGARLCLVLGDTELDGGVVAVKDLAAKTQTNVPRTAIVAEITAALERPPGPVAAVRGPRHSDGSA